MATIIEKEVDGHGPYLYKVSYLGHGNQKWEILGRKDQLNVEPGPVEDDWEHDTIKPADPEPSRKRMDELRVKADSKEEFGESVMEYISETLGVQTNDITEEEFTETQIKSIGAAIDMLVRADDDRMSQLGDFLDDKSRHQHPDSFRFVSGGLPRHGKYRSDHKFIKINTNKFDMDSVGSLPDKLVVREESVLEDIIIHEIGHAFHDMESKRPERVIKKQAEIPHERIRQEISSYAAEDPLEATAEMFLHQSLGNELPDDLEEIYENELDGPEPFDMT